MGNVIAIIVLLLILGLAIAKIVSEKRKGVKCIGCPHSGTSSKKHNSQACSCNHDHSHT